MTVYLSRLYVVGQVKKLDNLERGLVMYEICHNTPRQLVVGFVFVSQRGPELLRTDYRDVDGSVLHRFASFSPVTGLKKEDRGLKLDGFDRAISRYHASLKSMTGGAS